MIRSSDKRKPNVKLLARKGDVDGLMEAAAYTEVVAGPEGTSMEVGAPIREEALLALRELALHPAGDVFAVALGDPSDRVRCAAVVALYDREDSDLLAEAVARLPPAAGNARAMAERALFELHQPGSTSRLADAFVHRQDSFPLSEHDEALVPALLEVEEERPDSVEEVVQVLVSALAHEREIVTERAEALLARMGSASTDALIAELAHGAAPHRAASVLGDIKDPRALEPLVAALAHPDARVRSQSCFALGELRDPAAVEPLLEATRDPDHDVRVLAGFALDGLGTAAIAASVAALLRPMLGEALSTESVRTMLSEEHRPDDDHSSEPVANGKPEANGSQQTNGATRATRASRRRAAAARRSPPMA